MRCRVCGPRCARRSRVRRRGVAVDLRRAAAKFATASRSVQSGIGNVNRRFIVALSWSGRSASGLPGATGRVPARVSAENTWGWSIVATWATIPPTPIPARSRARRRARRQGPPRRRRGRAGVGGRLRVGCRRLAAIAEVVTHHTAPAGGEALADRVGQESIVVPPASRTSGASSSPNDSMPKATSLTLTVVIGLSSPGRRRPALSSSSRRPRRSCRR